jgi:hypothetical protein
MRLGFDRRLGELERHPVALADGQILGAILLSQAQGWGQIPHRLVPRFLTAEVIAAFSMTAPRERIIERIRALDAAGLDEIAFCIPNDGVRERIEELGREIVSRY